MFRLIAAKYWPEISSDAAPLMIPLRLSSVTGALPEKFQAQDWPAGDTAPRRQTDFAGRACEERPTIPMAVRLWCEPSSRLRATAFRKPAEEIPRSASPRRSRGDPPKPQLRRSARSIHLPERDASLRGNHHDRTPV